MVTLPSLLTVGRRRGGENKEGRRGVERAEGDYMRVRGDLTQLDPVRAGAQ